MAFVPGEPLDLGRARRGLVGALWAWSAGGRVVASTDHRPALEDLEWFGIEPDAMMSAARADRYAPVLEALVESGAAYPCFCSTSEMREMRPAPPGSFEAQVYDGRCSRLSEADRKALKKAGRKPVIRLRSPGGRVGLPAVRGALEAELPGWDFALTEPGGAPLPPLAGLVDDREGRVTHAVATADEALTWAMRAAIAERLGWALPRVLVIPPWPAPAASLAIAELRDAGFHPGALRSAALGGGEGSARPAEELAEDFDPLAVPEPDPALDLAALRALNARVLRGLDEIEQVEVLVGYLTRRGHPISEREGAWQRRFARAVLPSVEVLREVEPLAAILLAPTVDYDGAATAMLRRPAAREAIELFASLLPEEGADVAAWRAAIQRLRRESRSPGRALAVLRAALTGQREGPSLATIAALLGREACRQRLDKARRYAGS